MHFQTNTIYCVRQFRATTNTASMMHQYVIAVLALCLSMTVNGFLVAPRASTGAAFSPRMAGAKKLTYTSKSGEMASRAVTTSLSMVAKTEAATKNYWEGEWVCADCGYIYDQDDCGGLYFEQQKRGFVCPQCRGPRRRFAKKVGDKVGITQDGGDAPILLFSFLGLAGTVAFGFWFAQQ